MPLQSNVQEEEESERENNKTKCWSRMSQEATEKGYNSVQNVYMKIKFGEHSTLYDETILLIWRLEIKTNNSVHKHYTISTAASGIK